MEVKLTNFTTSDLKVQNIKIKTSDEFDKMGLRDYFDYDILPFEDFARSLNQICADFDLAYDMISTPDMWWAHFHDSANQRVAKIGFTVEIEPYSYIEDAMGTLASKCGGWKF